MGLFGQRTSRGLAAIALVGGFVGSGAAVVLASGIPEAGAVPLSPCPAPVISGTTATVTCSYNGTNGSDGSLQSWNVPAGVTQATLDVYGASGGEINPGNGPSFAGKGGEATGTLGVTPGTTLTVSVGGKGGDATFSLGSGATAGATGFGGGGAGGPAAGGGGGGSSVSDGPTSLVIAGGGGGTAVGFVPLGDIGAGGAGGGASGGFGGPVNPPSIVGTAPGTQSNGGVGSGNGGSGSAGQGGNGGAGTPVCGTGGAGAYCGGGGGGGYYGGAGGDNEYGGGGGSGYLDPSATNASMHTGVQAGNGKVVITYTLPADNDLAISPAANVTVDATGPSGAKVTYPVPTVSDPDDATAPTASCTPARGSTFAIGTTTVTCTATDAEDTNSPVSVTFSVIVTDDDLALTNMPSNQTLNATSPSGAVVNYTAPGVVDEDSPLPTVSCTPSSKSTFAIGTTTVTCTANDAEDTNSPVSKTFSVSVLGAAAQLADLQAAVTGVGTGTSLFDKVGQAQAYLAANDVTDACGALGAFIQEVEAQSGKHIPAATANTLIASATRIRAVLGC